MGPAASSGAQKSHHKSSLSSSSPAELTIRSRDTNVQQPSIPSASTPSTRPKTAEMSGTVAPVSEVNASQIGPPEDPQTKLDEINEVAHAVPKGDPSQTEPAEQSQTKLEKINEATHAVPEVDTSQTGTAKDVPTATTLHTAKPPPGHPPYEKHIDMRIPLHFAFVAPSGCDLNDDDLKLVKPFLKEAKKYIRSRGVQAFILLSRAMFDNSDAHDWDATDATDIYVDRSTGVSMGPMFWEVGLGDEEARKARVWTKVHEGLCELIRKTFHDRPDWLQLPIRYLLSYDTPF